jgi:hypothetical protein
MTVVSEHSNSRPHLKQTWYVSALDGKYATEFAVPAAEDELENPQQRVHASWARRR